MKTILIYAAITLILISIVLGGCSESVTAEADDESSGISSVSTLLKVEDLAIDTTGLFTERDLVQKADLDEAVYTELVSGEDVEIEKEGVYVISGDVENVIIKVKSDDEAKVQLVLNGVSIVNDNTPVIYIASADKVFVTLTDSENYLEVSGELETDGGTNLDAVIYSK